MSQVWSKKLPTSLEKYINLLKLSAGCENPDIRTDTDTDIRPPGPSRIRILADTDIRISAGIRITGRHLDAGGHPDAHRHPDTGRYPDAHRHPGTGRYRPTRPSSLKGLVPSDHLGLERKRLQLQPRSPLGVVLPGQTSKQH